MATTEKQIAANRRNSRKSTGPKTAVGKAKVSKNSIKHGLLSQLAVLPSLETQEDWDEHFAQVRESLQPESYLEHAIVERIALTLWRLARSARYERDVAAASIEKAPEDFDQERTRGFSMPRLKGIEVLEEEMEWQKGFGDFITWLKGADEKQSATNEYAAALIQESAKELDVNIYGGDQDFSFPEYPDGYELDELDWDVRHLNLCLEAIAGFRSKSIGDLLDLVNKTNVADMEETAAAIRALKAERDYFTRSRILLDGPSMDKVNRYETTLERSLTRYLAELERLRDKRSGGIDQ